VLKAFYFGGYPISDTAKQSYQMYTRRCILGRSWNVLSDTLPISLLIFTWVKHTKRPWLAYVSSKFAIVRPTSGKMRLQFRLLKDGPSKFVKSSITQPRINCPMSSKFGKLMRCGSAYSNRNNPAVDCSASLTFGMWVDYGFTELYLD